jgi:hypothetical protein
MTLYKYRNIFLNTETLEDNMSVCFSCYLEKNNCHGLDCDELIGWDNVFVLNKLYHFLKEEN